MTFTISRPRALRRPGAIALLGLAGAVAATALLAPPAEARKGKGGPKVKVMTRNVYLGADLTPALESSSLGEAIDATGVILNEVDANKFEERAELLAAEIKKAKPDLIGLQEVALWRQGVADGPPDLIPGATSATEVRYDYLELLLGALKSSSSKGSASKKGKGNKKGKGRGPRYEVVDVKREFDQELPVDEDQSDATGNPALFGADLDGRLTMRDVILAKKGSKVKLGKTRSDTYETLYEPSVGGIPLQVERGWQSVEARVTGKRSRRADAANGGETRSKGKGKGKRRSKRARYSFRFVNTHLEAFGEEAIREAQAKELRAKGGPLRTRKQVILVGDLNSGLAKHGISGDDRLAFKVLKRFGMKDRGARHTCCQSSLVSPTPAEWDHTVDHVLVKPGIRRKKAKVIGDDLGDRTPSGLIASDHAGVWSKLVLRKRR